MPGRAERKETSRIERRAEDRAAARGDVPGEVETPHRGSKKKSSRCFRLEYRWRKKPSVSFWRDKGWQPYWRRYATEKQRDAAMVGMNRQNTLFEYRIPVESAD